MQGTMRIDLTPPPGTVPGSVPTVQADGSVAWATPPPSGTRVDHWVTGNTSELVGSLPMNPSQFQVAYSLPCPDIRDGDVVVALAEFEVTNPYGRDPWDSTWNAMVTGWVILGDSPSSTTGIEVTENNGFNIDPNMHHGVLTKVGSVRPKGTDLGDKYVNVVLRAASSRAEPGDALILDQDYGRLTVLRFRNH